MNALAGHTYDDSSNSSPSTSTMLNTPTENVGRITIKRPTSLNVSKPTGRYEKNDN